MSDDKSLLIGSIILNVWFGVLLCLIPNVNSERAKWEADAVKHGAATWSVDENGNRVFEWKEQEQEQGEK